MVGRKFLAGKGRIRLKKGRRKEEGGISKILLLLWERGEKNRPPSMVRMLL